MRLLITGCTGFLGRNISEGGVLNGYHMLGVSRSARPEGWCGDYLQRNRLSDLDPVIHDFSPDVIMHVAGPASVDASFVDPLTDQSASVLTWINLLDSVRRSEVMPLVVFPSSAAVYGNPQVLPIAEDSAIAPISPYGFHKAACELIAREYSECFGLDIVVCRFFSLFGVAQQRLLVWELYEQLAGNDSTVWLEGTGTESRDYLDVNDATSAVFHLIMNRLAARNQRSHSGGETFIVNIGSGEETNVLHLAAQLRDLVAPGKRICCRGNQQRGAPQRWCADVSRLRSLIPQWQPSVLSKSLAECVASWHNCHNVV